MKKHLSQLNNLLAASAAHVNDRYSYRADYQARRRARLEDDNGDEIPGDAEAEAMRIRADELTVRIEEGVRASIDAQAKVEATEAALKEVYENASRGGGIVAPTQSTLGASQFRGTRRDLDDDEEDDGTDRQGLTGAVKTKIDDRQTRYTNLSMGERCVHELVLESKIGYSTDELNTGILQTMLTRPSSVSFMMLRRAIWKKLHPLPIHQRGLLPTKALQLARRNHKRPQLQPCAVIPPTRAS